jgi:hypothetical protein
MSEGKVKNILSLLDGDMSEIVKHLPNIILNTVDIMDDLIHHPIYVCLSINHISVFPNKEPLLTRYSLIQALLMRKLSLDINDDIKAVCDEHEVYLTTFLHHFVCLSIHFNPAVKYQSLISFYEDKKDKRLIKKFLSSKDVPLYYKSNLIDNIELLSAEKQEFIEIILTSDYNPILVKTISLSTEDTTEMNGRVSYFRADIGRRVRMNDGIVGNGSFVRVTYFLYLNKEIVISTNRVYTDDECKLKLLERVMGNRDLVLSILSTLNITNKRFNLSLIEIYHKMDIKDVRNRMLDEIINNKLELFQRRLQALCKYKTYDEINLYREGITRLLNESISFRKSQVAVLRSLLNDI